VSSHSVLEMITLHTNKYSQSFALLIISRIDNVQVDTASELNISCCFSSSMPWMSVCLVNTVLHDCPYLTVNWDEVVVLFILDMCIDHLGW